jgi:hypothetical protein
MLSCLLNFSSSNQTPLTLPRSVSVPLSPQAFTSFERGERDCASARLTLNSLLVRGTGCHRKDLLLGTNADGGVPGAAIRRAGPGEKLDARCLRRRELGPLCLRRIILELERLHGWLEGLV